MKRKVGVALAVILSTGLLAGATGAEEYVKVTAANPVSVGTVRVALQETKEKSYEDMPGGVVTLSGTYMPGATIPKQIRAVSRGNRPSYISIVAEISEKEAVELVPGLESGAQPLVTDDWIICPKEQTTVYYYRYPVPAGNATPACIESLKLFGGGSDAGNEWAGRQLTVKFTARAVQQTKAEAAMNSAWGITPIIGEDGKLDEIL